MSSMAEIYQDSETNGFAGNLAIQVERGVPLPEKKAKPLKVKAPKVPKYPFKEMTSPGDSFFIPNVDSKKANSVVQTGKKTWPGSRWTVKTLDGGTRVWRVS